MKKKTFLGLIKRCGVLGPLNHLCVGAASILAKAERDRLFLEICQGFEKEYGVIKGGGYPTCPDSAFYAVVLEKKGGYPLFFRRSY